MRSSLRRVTSALNKHLTSENVKQKTDAEIVEHFGAPIRADDEGLLRAEELVNPWRSLFHPNAACGSRSYTLIGKTFLNRIFGKLVLIDSYCSTLNCFLCEP